MTHRKTAACVF